VVCSGRCCRAKTTSGKIFPLDWTKDEVLIVEIETNHERGVAKVQY
jgi:hypothetical protein